MAPPDAAFSFTIPSIHDDLVLDCRVYHPETFLVGGDSSGPRWKPKGAIVAHPYAPMGGSQYDPVVGAMAKSILTKDTVVGTFNFRGAGTSKGRTSWTAKAELADYISFAGFFINYLQQIMPQQHDVKTLPERITSENTLTPIPSAALVPPHRHHDAPHPEKEAMTLILGGYSYGSMITSHLPSTATIVARFTGCVEGSAEAEIRLRASSLASQWNAEERRKRDESQRQRARHTLDPHRSNSRSIVVGGEESERGSRRSHDSRRSMDSVRRSFDFSRKSLSRRRRDRSSDSNAVSVPEEAPTRFDIRTYYLLISPLLPPVSAFATMFSSIGQIGKADAWNHIVTNPTLAIYGDKDSFTSSRKLAKWADELSHRPGSTFQAREIQNAGHFWHEDGAEKQLICHVEQYIDDALNSSNIMV